MTNELDRLTIAMMLATSSVEAAERFRRDEAEMIPAYDELPDIQPRDQVRRCMRQGCGRRFVHAGMAPRRFYCSDRCKWKAEDERRGRPWRVA